MAPALTSGSPSDLSGPVPSGQLPSNTSGSMVKDCNIPVELHDGVFHVCQVTRSTALECMVGADLVHVEPRKQSHMHRHNRAETVLFITAGAGEVLLDGIDDATCTRVPVAKGDRITIAAGRYHAIRTVTEPLDFLSVQMPPILDKASGTLDLEWLVPPSTAEGAHTDEHP